MNDEDVDDWQKCNSNTNLPPTEDSMKKIAKSCGDGVKHNLGMGIVGNTNYFIPEDCSL